MNYTYNNFLSNNHFANQAQNNQQTQENQFQQQQQQNLPPMPQNFPDNQSQANQNSQKKDKSKNNNENPSPSVAKENLKIPSKWEWLPCNYELKREADGIETHWSLAPTIQLAGSDPAVNPIMDITIDLERNFMHNDDLGWNWHKSWNLPNIAINIKITDPATNEYILPPADLKAQLMAVKVLLNKAEQFKLTDLGLKGQFVQDLSEGQVTFSGIKFSSTSYNNDGVKFHLIVLLYVQDDARSRACPKILYSKISPPIFVDSRKSARDANTTKKVMNKYFDPFGPENFEKTFVKRNTKFNESKEEQIENNLEGLSQYFTAPNIRNKVKHPFFLATKFSKCVRIFYNRKFHPDILGNEFNENTLVQKLQKVLIESSIKTKAKNDQNSKVFDNKHIILLVEELENVNAFQLTKKISDNLDPIINDVIHVVFNNNIIPGHFVSLDSELLKKIYARVYPTLVQLKNQLAGSYGDEGDKGRASLSKVKSIAPNDSYNKKRSQDELSDDDESEDEAGPAQNKKMSTVDPGPQKKVKPDDVNNYLKATAMLQGNNNLQGFPQQQQQPSQKPPQQGHQGSQPTPSGNNNNNNSQTFNYFLQQQTKTINSTANMRQQQQQGSSFGQGNDISVKNEDQSNPQNKQPIVNETPRSDINIKSEQDSVANFANQFAQNKTPQNNNNQNFANFGNLISGGGNNSNNNKQTNPNMGGGINNNNSNTPNQSNPNSNSQDMNALLANLMNQNNSGNNNQNSGNNNSNQMQQLMSMFQQQQQQQPQAPTQNDIEQQNDVYNNYQQEKMKNQILMKLLYQNMMKGGNGQQDPQMNAQLAQMLQQSQQLGTPKQGAISPSPSQNQPPKQQQQQPQMQSGGFNNNNNSQNSQFNFNQQQQNQFNPQQFQQNQQNRQQGQPNQNMNQFNQRQMQQQQNQPNMNQQGFGQQQQGGFNQQQFQQQFNNQNQQQQMRNPQQQNQQNFPNMYNFGAMTSHSPGNQNQQQNMQNQQQRNFQQNFNPQQQQQQQQQQPNFQQQNKNNMPQNLPPNLQNLFQSMQGGAMNFGGNAPQGMNFGGNQGGNMGQNNNPGGQQQQSLPSDQLEQYLRMMANQK